jgi:hypothetical protein
VLGGWLGWLDVSTFWAFATATWQATIMSALTAVVSVLALCWAPVVIVRADRGWAGALLAFVAGLLWIGQQVEWIVLDHTALGGVLAAVLVVVLAGRILLRRSRLRTSGTA